MKTAALRAVINFIQCLSSSADRDRFQDLLPMMMMRTLIEALKTGQGALVLLIELAGTEPRFLGRQLVNVMRSMLQIAEDESLEEGTRHLAVEFVITLAEAGERKLTLFKSHVMPRFISQLFVILMKMLLDIEDDPAWHSADREDEDAGEPNNYSVGQECLDRLAISLGGIPLYLLLGSFCRNIWLRQNGKGTMRLSLLLIRLQKVVRRYWICSFSLILFALSCFSTFIKFSGNFVGVVLFPPMCFCF